MKYIVTLNGKQYEVEVDKGQATAMPTGDAPVIAAAPAPAPVAAAPAPAPAAAPAAAPAGAETISSPMPGTILQVKCAAGQAVKRGDVLFILEAMKMENEISAPAGGTVREIRAREGDSVNTGDVLIVLG